MNDPASPTPVARARRNGLGDLLWRSACRTPEKTALIFGPRQWSYAALDEAADRVANALAAHGVQPGERVALLAHNHDQYAVLVFALARLGAILVPVNFMLKAAEVAYILAHSEAVMLIAEDALLPVAHEALAVPGVAVRYRAVLGDDPAAPAGWARVADWLVQADRRPLDTAVDDDAPVQILYTSGTESRPKGATLSTRNLLAQYVSCIVDGEMAGDDVEVHALPLFHCAQQHCFLLPGLMLGATNLLLPGAEAGALLATVEAVGATKLFCPPTVWIALLRHPHFDPAKLSTLRKGYYGASIMPMEVIRELSQRLPLLRLFNFYGQTEMSPVATVLKPEDQLRKLGSAGRACLNVETRVVDDDDAPVPPGTVGEIVHRGPHVMLGYWHDEQKTAEVFRNGWFHSGDLGVVDGEGYLRVVDRKKDMIKTGGENVASREVEEVVYAHPAVAEAAVVGLPDPRWIEAVTAVVVCRHGHALDEAALIAHCRAHLAGFKVPKRVLFVDALPKNASGKLLKRELRSRLAGAAA